MSDPQKDQRSGDDAAHAHAEDAVAAPAPVHGPGRTRLEQLAEAGAPGADDLAALLGAYPRERGAMIALVQERFGNAVADQALRGVAGPGLPQAADLDPDAAARELVSRGLQDENRLTDELFWRRYPALRDLPLAPATPAAAEWMRLRGDHARPALRGLGAVVDATPKIEVEPLAPLPAPAVTVADGPVGGGGGAKAEGEGPLPLPAPSAPTRVEAVLPELETVSAAPEVTAIVPEEGGDKEAGKEAPPQPKVTAPQPAGPTPFPDPKTIKTDAKTEAPVLNAVRMHEQRFEPVWMMAFQRALGVTNVSGAFNTDTLRKLRERAAKDGVAEDAMFREDYLVKIHPGQPFFDPDEGARTHKSEKKVAGNKDRDRAARYVGRADYAAWKSEWVDIKMLDITLGEGHPLLAARVEAADAFLRARHPGEPADKIRAQIGWKDGNSVAAYFLDGVDMHNMGLALDINMAQNAWFFRGGGKHDQDNEALFAEAARMFGGAQLTASYLLQLSRTKSTEEMWAIVNQSSESIAKFLALVKRNSSGELDETKFKAEVKKLKPAWDDAKIEHAYQIGKGAEALFHDKNYGQQYARSVTNHKEEMLVALRDAAGLAWGGAEISGSVNGDFMHFDLRGADGTGGEVWDIIANIRFGTALKRPEDKDK